MIITISQARKEHQTIILSLLEQMELDNRDCKMDDFIIAFDGEKIIGFGRIKQHGSCDELCSLGVIEPERYKGIGSELVKNLIKKATQPLFLTCIIPEFFEKLGFIVSEDFPPEIASKLNYCIHSLPVPETYVVMKLN